MFVPNMTPQVSKFIYFWQFAPPRTAVRVYIWLGIGLDLLTMMQFCQQTINFNFIFCKLLFVHIIFFMK